VSTPRALRDFVDDAGRGVVPDAPELWGPDGLHVGVVAAVAASASRRTVRSAAMQSLTVQLHAAVSVAATVEVEVVHQSAWVTTTSARLVSGGEVQATAAAVFGHGDAVDRGLRVPLRPGVPDPLACPAVERPGLLAPINDQLDVRPVGPNRPFGGGWEPELVAWVRVADDDRPPDVSVLAVLLDALGPSWTAVLTDPVVVRAVEFAYHPSTGLAAATSPWALIRSRTRSIEPSGWVTEEIDAWGRDGTYLARADQVRLVRHVEPQPARS
jgi:hypothetical protein